MQTSPKPFYKRPLVILAIVFFYFATAIPLGMLVYSVKTDMGWNIFTRTGYHAFARCLQQEMSHIQPAVKQP